jgi:hypothetical protein
MWISAEFKIYLIKEFQRLKGIAQRQLSVLTDSNHLRNIKRLSGKSYLDAGDK